MAIYRMRLDGKIIDECRDIDSIMISIMFRHLYETQGISTINELINNYLNPIACNYGLLVEEIVLQ